MEMQWQWIGLGDVKGSLSELSWLDMNPRIDHLEMAARHVLPSFFTKYIEWTVSEMSKRMWAFLMDH